MTSVSDVLTKEFTIAFIGSALTSSLELEYDDDECEKEYVIDMTGESSLFASTDNGGL